jgi:hypothetical protein
MCGSKRWLLVVVIVAVVFASAAAFMRNGDFDPPSAGGNEAVTAQHSSWVDLANPARNPSVATKTPLRSGYGSYIVMFEEAPLAAYRGEVAGIPAPRRDVKAKNGRLRLDVAGATARAYVSHLRKRQAALNARMASILGRPVPVKASMHYAVNAVLVDLSIEEADAIRAMPGVSFVEAPGEYETASDRGAQLIGAVPVWDGTNPGSGGVQYRGEGMVVAVLDTGINFGSPSFAATSPVDGYIHTNPQGAGNYLGTCANGGADIGRCNSKLIGGFDFVCGAPGNQCGLANVREESGFGDTNGHGSHVASIAAGNLRDAQLMGTTVRISGVAPRASLIAYDVCYTDTVSGTSRCPLVSALAALDSVIATGLVDAVNFSVDITGFSGQSASLELALLRVVDVGIYVSTPAFQSDKSNISEVLWPWVATVAAVSHDRRAIAFPLDIAATPSMPPDLARIMLIEGSTGVRHTSPIPAGTPLKVSPSYGYFSSPGDGCSGFSANTFAGAIAVLGQGGCGFDTKVANAVAAGAIAVVIVRFPDFVESYPKGPDVPDATVPVFAMRRTDGDALSAFAATQPNIAAGIGYPAIAVAATPDVLSSNSASHYPINGSNSMQGFLKPDFAAPGMNILAADAGTALTGDEGLVGIKSGTSMAAASHSGAVALLRQARPTWSVSEAKSAFALTATAQIQPYYDTALATVYYGGSGRIRVDRAINAGLVMHETPANYGAAFPEANGSSSALNQPYLVNRGCRRVCRFLRTFRNPTSRASTWNLRSTGNGIDATMPASITVPAGGSATVEIALRAVGGKQQMLTGELTLVPTDPSQTPLRLPILISSRSMRGDDYDGDGRSDIHWRNHSTGRNDLWLMNATAPNALLTIYNEPNLSWQVVGSGDFNGDAAADVLWRNAQSGAVYVQLQFAGTTLAISNYAPTVADPNWQIVAISDMDADGKSDLLWRNSQSGRNDAWLMDGTWPKAISTIYVEPDPTWKVKGARGGTIFWRNEATGRNYVQFTNGSTVYGDSNFILAVSDQVWQIAAVDDFDGDGDPDLYWRNRQTGFNDVWLMDRSRVAIIINAHHQPDQNWQVVNSGDYNNDGFADLLWRNAATGENYMMLTRLGRPLPESAMLIQVADLNWRVTGLPGSN